MLRRVSLANKCLLLFGAAVVLIIFAALAVPLFRMSSVVDEGQREVSRRMIDVYEATIGSGADAPAAVTLAGGRVELLNAARAAEERKSRPFVGESWDALAQAPALTEHGSVRSAGPAREYGLARAVRDASGGLQALVVLERRSPEAARELLVNTVYLGSAGAVALGMAVLTFYLITSKLILGPVRDLRDTAEEVRRGNLEIRSTIETGDEFEELADAFNGMLTGLQETEAKLRSINAALDNRVIDLQSQNSMLEGANRVKGEFLANVSHELRTPLNSILGFADLLIEAAEKEAAAGDDSTRLAKRRRYVENIQSSGRTLLDLINGLLEMAKVEAGKVEITHDRVDLREFAEALIALMRPVADKRGVELRLEVQGDGVAIETDGRKLQQVVFNLLSNAVKFTGDAADRRAEAMTTAREGATSGDGPPSTVHTPPLVTLRIERLLSRAAGGAAEQGKVRISVLDTGPGIAPEFQEIIFEKFTQLSRGLNRTSAGTGLGLAICKELTALLQGEIQVESALGRGAMFSVILPERLDPARIAESKLEARFRVSLAGGGRASAATGSP